MHVSKQQDKREKRAMDKVLANHLLPGDEHANAMLAQIMKRNRRTTESDYQPDRYTRRNLGSKGRHMARLWGAGYTVLHSAFYTDPRDGKIKRSSWKEQVYGR